LRSYLVGSLFDSSRFITFFRNKLQEVGLLKERLERAEADLAERQRILQQAKERAEAALKQREEDARKEIARYIT
jgi:hypothetical protein